MPKREIEGDWVMGWPDRKRAELAAGKDADGRVISGRTPILDQEGLITPTDNYYIVTQLDMPEPVHPGRLVAERRRRSRARRRRSRSKTCASCPGRTRARGHRVRGQRRGLLRLPAPRRAQAVASLRAGSLRDARAMRANRATPTNDELAGEMGNTCAMSGGEFTGVPLAEVLKRAGLKPGAQWVWLKGFDTRPPRPGRAVSLHGPLGRDDR